MRNWGRMAILRHSRSVREGVLPGWREIASRTIVKGAANSTGRRGHVDPPLLRNCWRSRRTRARSGTSTFPTERDDTDRRWRSRIDHTRCRAMAVRRGRLPYMANYCGGKRTPVAMGCLIGANRLTKDSPFCAFTFLSAAPLRNLRSRLHESSTPCYTLGTNRRR